MEGSSLSRFKYLIRIAYIFLLVKGYFKISIRQNSRTFSQHLEYTGVYITNEGGIRMKRQYHEEPAQATTTHEDVDDLIFRASPDWLVSDR